MSKISKMHVKKGDKVVVISGSEKGKKGQILEVSPKKRTVVIEGINKVTKHQKPRRQDQPGGIVVVEAPMPACKVMNICGKCQKPTRIGRVRLTDGSLVRRCKRCEETID